MVDDKGELRPIRMGIGHLISLTAVLVSVAIGWGVLSQRVEQNAEIIRRYANVHDQWNERLQKLRDKQAELEGRIRALEHRDDRARK